MASTTQPPRTPAAAVRLCPECAGRVWLSAEPEGPSEADDMAAANAAVEQFVAGLNLPAGIISDRDKAMWAAGFRAGVAYQRRQARLENCTVLLGML